MNQSDLLISIENSASFIAEHLGTGEIDWILTQYHARSIEDLNPSEYEAVFSELFQREADLRSDL